MGKKHKISLLFFLIAVSIVASFVVMTGIQTVPSGLFQKLLLGDFRNCIWYGFEGDEIFDDTHNEETEIVLPDSLAYFTPLKLRLGLKEHNTLNQDCDLIYNPKGYENGAWLINIR